jgi:hypothetical protein
VATGLTGINSANFNITFAVPNKLIFSSQPTTTLAGAAFSPAVAVTVQDTYGNTVTTATNVITITVGGGVNLSGNITATPNSGVATFNPLTVSGLAGSYILTATATGLTSATSSAFNIKVPSAPGYLTATAVSTTMISLVWPDVTGETSFKIERSSDGSSYSQIGTTAQFVVTYLDTGPSIGTEYWYRVRANNAAGDSNYSPVTSTVTWPYAGDGTDGSATITTATNMNTQKIGSTRAGSYADAVAFVVTGTVNAGATSLVVTATPNGLAGTDEVIIINLKGTVTDSSKTGLYEFKTISLINSTTITFTSAISNTYGNAATGQRIMLQRVPHYNNITINSGGSLTISPWNGITGGVLAFRVNGAVNIISGTISANACGFRGGAGTAYNARANGGESYNGFAGGGGLYNSTALSSTGGGGGGGYNDPTGYSGASGQAGSGGGGGGAVYGTGSSCYIGGCGGGGAYGDSTGTGGVDGDGYASGTNGGVPNGGNGGNAHSAYCAGAGGGGGGIIGNSTTLNQRAYLGGGGGAGGGAYGKGSTATSGAGGNGGGIVFIAATTITVATGASINANGGAGGNGVMSGLYTYSGPGGGGAGGSIILLATKLTDNNQITTNGGSGGVNSAMSLYGPNGGGGRTYARYSSLSGTAPTPNYSGP